MGDEMGKGVKEGPGYEPGIGERREEIGVVTCWGE
jgi:hypothetical protein